MRAPIVVVAALVLAAGLVGCGSGDADESGSPPSPTAASTEADAATGDDGTQEITLRANADLRFTPGLVRAHTGPLRITVENVGGGVHDLKSDGTSDVGIARISPGQSETTTMTFNQPGRYQFLCTFHSGQGMTGVFDITAA